MSHEFGRQIDSGRYKAREIARKVALQTIALGAVSGITLAPSVQNKSAEHAYADSHSVVSAHEARKSAESELPNAIPFESFHSSSVGTDKSLVFLGTQDQYPLQTFLEKQGYYENHITTPKINLNNQFVLILGERFLADEKVTDNLNPVKDRNFSTLRVQSIEFSSEDGMVTATVVGYGSEVCEDQLSLYQPQEDKQSINDAFEPLTPGDWVIATLPEGISSNAVNGIKIIRKEYGIDINGCIVGQTSSMAFIETSNGQAGPTIESRDVTIKQ